MKRARRAAKGIVARGRLFSVSFIFVLYARRRYSIRDARFACHTTHNEIMMFLPVDESVLAAFREQEGRRAEKMHVIPRKVSLNSSMKCFASHEFTPRGRIHDRYPAARSNIELIAKRLDLRNLRDICLCFETAAFEKSPRFIRHVSNGSQSRVARKHRASRSDRIQAGVY